MIDVFHQRTAEFETFLLVLLRSASILALIPIFSGSQIPKPARIGLAVVISYVVGKSIPPIALLSSPYDLAMAAISQVLVAFVFGFIAYLVFMGITFAGEIVDTMVGFAVVNVINPVTQTSVTIVSEFQTAIATIIYLATDSHHLLLQGLAGTFTLVPLPYAHLDAAVNVGVVADFQDALLIIFKIAAPVAVALFLTNVSLGLLARVAPQINVFVVGLPLQVGVGLVMIALSLPLLGYALPTLFDAVPRQIDTVMRELK